MRIFLLIPAIFLAFNLTFASTFSQYLDKSKVKSRTPDELFEDYKSGEINSSQLWYKMPHDKKVSLIGLLKDKFREEDRVKINISAEYYTKVLINLFNSHPEFLSESLKSIFAAIAMQHNDFYEENIKFENEPEEWFGDNFLIMKPEKKGKGNAR